MDSWGCCGRRRKPHPQAILGFPSCCVSAKAFRPGEISGWKFQNRSKESWASIQIFARLLILPAYSGLSGNPGRWCSSLLNFNTWSSDSLIKGRRLRVPCWQLWAIIMFKSPCKPYLLCQNNSAKVYSLLRRVTPDITRSLNSWEIVLQNLCPWKFIDFVKYLPRR